MPVRTGLKKTGPARNRYSRNSIGNTRPENEYYDQIAFDLARVYLRQNEIANARTIYQQAVGARPEHTGFRYELARTYLFDRNWEKAIPLLEPLVADAEDSPEFLEHVLFDLGRSLERAGQYDRAVAIFSAAFGTGSGSRRRQQLFGVYARRAR